MGGMFPNVLGQYRRAAQNHGLSKEMVELNGWKRVVMAATILV